MHHDLYVWVCVVSMSAVQGETSTVSDIPEVTSTSSALPNAADDHNYCARPPSPSTPRKTRLKEKLAATHHQLASQRKRIKSLLQSKRRLLKRNGTLKIVEKKWYSEECYR